MSLISCLLGDPVAHSVSHVMFPLFSSRSSLSNYAHVKFRVRSEKPEDIKVAVRAIQVLGIAGANVTLPYKQGVVSLMDERDDSATSVGAVNTIVKNGGKLTGYNTDGNGALQAIEI